MSTGPILVIAAHPDDEVLGCGGYLALSAARGRAVHVLILADGESSRLQSNNDQVRRHKSAQKAADVLGIASVTLLNLPDNRLDSVDLLNIVQHIEKQVLEVKPSTVLTHHHGDVNVDHQIAHEATLAACRPLPESSVRELLFFEIPSSTEWRPAHASSAFFPTVFVDISQVAQQKKQALLAYAAELRPAPHPRSLESIDALAIWRGAMVGFPRAEAFALGRALWS
jgi:N-acetylglucosamine malate deacetylase 1